MIDGQIAIPIIVALATTIIVVVLVNSLKKYYIGTIVQLEKTDVGSAYSYSYYFDVQYVVEKTYKTKRIEVTYETYAFFKVGDKITVCI